MAVKAAVLYEMVSMKGKKNHMVKLLIGNVLEMCVKKVLALVKKKDRARPHRCPKFDHDDVVIYTPKGDHVGTKMKVWYTRATAKTEGTKRGQIRRQKWCCEKLQDGKPIELVLQRGEAFKEMESVCVVERNHTQRTAQKATWGKPAVSTPFLPVLLKMMKRERKPFSTSWLVDVERVYMPLIVYDSLRSTTHSRKATTKLAPTSYVLPDLL
ncbi:hypothetical protein DVH24_020947 [Malus domestica]|uniref:Uncharacterized protein n=1 Tax=Malus domestica TaxID=3750 RepID=A0A498JCZ2_MALDO|nr:hypothetical protein DVH24_020947 [Malus domestica]